MAEHQVKVSLDISIPWSHVNSDGSDIRFTSSDGVTELSFWLENWTYGTSGTLWVRIPLLSEASDNIIYMYYGNDQAENASDGDLTFEFFDDFSGYVQTQIITHEAAISKAISWIKVAQDVYVDGIDATGVANHYSYPSGPWSGPDYQEVTGYTIPTVFDQYHSLEDANLRSRAIQMSDWLVRMQNADGTWEVSIYNTGQVIDGLLRAYDELIISEDEDERAKAAGYLSAATEAGDFLVSTQEADGSWNNARCFNGFPHAYHSRMDWPMLRLWQRTGNDAYLTATVENLYWILSLEENNTGWFNNNGLQLSQNTRPITHAIGYCAEGLLESGLILLSEATGANDTLLTIAANCVDAATRTADALLGQIQADGSFTGGAYYSDWITDEPDECLTGSAQMSIVWSRLYYHTNNQNYLDASRAMNRYLVSVQGNSANTGIDGGIAGSDPINGFYSSNQILPWATKFFIDALYLENLYGGDYEYSVTGIDPDKWITVGSPILEFVKVNDNDALSIIGNDSHDFFITTVNTGFTDFILETNVMLSEDQSPQCVPEVGFRYTDIANRYITQLRGGPTTNDLFLRKYHEGTWYINSSTPYDYSADLYYKFRISATGNAITLFFNDIEVASPTNAGGDVLSGGICLQNWGNDYPVYFDDVRIRKIALAEPEAIVGTVEEGIIRWEGTLSSAWEVAGNWTSTVPGLTDDVVIVGADFAPQITANAECNNLIIESAASLIVASEGGLTIENDLTINGSLIVNSAMASSGSLIVNGTATGNITYNRQLKPGSDATSDWHLAAAPVATNSDANTGKVNTVFQWSEIAGAWSTTDITSALPGHGYNIRQEEASDGVISFTGPIVNSDLTVAASSPYADAIAPDESYFDRAYVSGRSLENLGGRGWNLPGNPFPSAINASAFINANYNATPSLSQFDPNYVALYLFDGTSRRYYYVANYTGWPSGTDLSATHIQAGQGFFVLAMNDNSEFLFTRAMQEHSTATAMLKSGGTDDRWPGLQLKVTHPTGEVITTVVYNQETTTGVDPGYDIGLFKSGQDVELYTILPASDNGINYTRQALPLSVADTIVVPVGVDTEDGGEVVFSAVTVPAGTNKFWLEDRTAGTFTDLSSSTYTVTLPAESYGTGRFYIIASTNTPTGVNLPEQETGLRIWSSFGKIIIKGPVTNGSLCELFDLQGNRILKTHLTDGDLNTVSLPAGTGGVCLVRVTDGVKVTSKKVIVL
ncbi:MAG: DUF2341 domain-containing protein [Bacteroidales bacterium]|nr:DUF2341 domain-containing protein [Bacteroidales bacterium]